MRISARKKLLVAATLLVVVAGIGFWERPVSYFNEMQYLRERLTGVESRTIEVAGMRVHYLAEGPANGPVVVLVHGLGGHAEDWLHIAPYLARAGYRVYMPDLIGYGRSEKPAAFSYSVQDEANVVVGFFDALGLRQVDLGGWSMGGWIVQLVASEHPERINRLMLFDAAGLDIKPAWNTALFTPTSPQELDELEALLTPHPGKIPGFVARDILRFSRERAWVIRRATASMLTGQNVTDKLLPGLKMPVLIVWGSADRIFPVSQGETMHKLVPQSELDVISGCGHLAPVECAGRIGPKVVAFVKR